MIQRIVVPDLNGGVSRQPDGQRFPNQVEEATNVNLHLSTGLEKRAGSVAIAQYTLDIAEAKVHWINRSPTERYILTYREDATTPITIRDIAGGLCTLTWFGDAKAYVNTAPGNLRMITVDDTTIIVNTTIATALDADTETYQFGGTDVQNNGNAHNKESWEEFDLPPTATSEYWYAKNDALGHGTGWYQSVSTTTQPWYNRVRTPMAGSIFDVAGPNTMPIRIVQTGPDTFEGRVIDWNPRMSGDSSTNPGPSFIGKKITDLAIHRNRLWFSAGENVCASASGEFYNFWLESYDNVVDSDPIDVKLSSSEVTKISWMTAFQRALVVYTESGQQYEIRAQEAMTPTTVQITASTAYTSPVSRPITIGSQLYWAANKGPWSQVYEYLTDEQTAQSVAVDVLSHVEGYVPSGIVEMKASSSNDMLFLRTGNNEIFVNYMFWQGQKKIQASWAKWTLPTGDLIIGFHVFDDKLYLVSRDGIVTRTLISYIPLRNSDDLSDPDNLKYTPRLDKSRYVNGSWNPTTKQTTFILPMYIQGVNSIVLGEEWDDQQGLRYTPVSSTPDAGTGNTTVIVNGNLTASLVIAGILYNMDVQLSRQYVRDQNGVQAYGTLQLKQLTVHHRNTGYFELVIDPHTKPSSDRTYKYTGKQLGSVGFITNTNVLSDRDSQNFKIMHSSNGVDLYLRSNTPSPCNLTGLEFAADFIVTKRSAAST